MLHFVLLLSLVNLVFTLLALVRLRGLREWLREVSVTAEVRGCRTEDEIQESYRMISVKHGYISDSPPAWILRIFQRQIKLLNLKITTEDLKGRYHSHVTKVSTA